jgi:hypothetical protein
MQKRNSVKVEEQKAHAKNGRAQESAHASTLSFKFAGPRARLASYTSLPHNHNTIMAAVKGIVKAEQMDGSQLRVAIVHARWNREVIDALVGGAVTSLKAHGVKESNIVVQSVPGSFELPLAAQRCVYSLCMATSNLIVRVLA